MVRVMRLLIVAAGLAGFSQAAWADAVDDYITTEMARRSIPGVAISVVRDGRIERAQGYGFANLEHKVAVHPDTLFKTGAAGMQFTAVAVMLLVEDGKIALDASVRDYLPNTPASWQPITIRHLLNHSSGLPATPGGEFLVEYTDDSLLAVISALPLNFEAGSRWRFSFSNYIVLGFVMDKVTGGHYSDYMARRVFAPLHMRTAQKIDEGALVPNRAAGYDIIEGKPRNPPPVSAFANSTADGSLYLSALDLAAWASGGLGRSLLSRSSWQALAQPARLNSGRTYPYGFGWYQHGSGNRARWQHAGNWQGFQMAVVTYPAANLTIAVMANGSSADPAAMLRDLVPLHDPRLAAPSAAPLGTSRAQIDQRVVGLLRQIADGSGDAAAFADFSARDFTDMMAIYRAMLTQQGDLGDIALFGDRMMGDDRVYHYRARYAKGVVDVRLGIAPNGKIGSLEIAPIADWTAPFDE